MAVYRENIVILLLSI